MQMSANEDKANVVSYDDFIAQFQGEKFPPVNFPCDVCSNTNWRPDGRRTHRLGIESTRFSVYQCRSCSFMRLFPLPTADELELIYGSYASRGDRMIREWRRAEFIYPDKLERVAKITQGKRLLDVGAGLGTFVHVAQERGFDAIGLEYSADQCAEAHSEYGVTLINDVIENWTSHFKPHSFDIINLHHVMEHVSSPADTINILRQLIAPGGVLIIEVPNQFFNVKKEIKSHISPSMYQGNPLHHLSFFSPQNLIDLIDSRGFETISCRQFWPNAGRPRRGWRRVSDEVFDFLFERYRIGSSNIIETFSKPV